MNDSQPGIDEVAGIDETSPEIVTRSFSLRPVDLEYIESIRIEEGLLSGSAALRQLLKDAKRFREENKTS